MTAAFRSHLPAKPVVRDDHNAEPCGRCGQPTTERLAPQGRRGLPEVVIECPACGWLRPAAPAVEASTAVRSQQPPPEALPMEPPPGPCPFCREAFRDAARLQVHLSNRHGAEVAARYEAARRHAGKASTR